MTARFSGRTECFVVASKTGGHRPPLHAVWLFQFKDVSSFRAAALVILVRGSTRDEIDARLPVHERYNDGVSRMRVRRGGWTGFPDHDALTLANLPAEGVLRIGGPKRTWFLEFDEHRTKRFIAGAFFAVRDSASKEVSQATVLAGDRMPPSDTTTRSPLV
jgi:hypothetical protein